MSRFGDYAPEDSMIIPVLREERGEGSARSVRGETTGVYIGIFQSVVCRAAVVLWNDPLPFAG